MNRPTPRYIRRISKQRWRLASSHWTALCMAPPREDDGRAAGAARSAGPASYPAARSAWPAGRDDLAERGLALLLQEAHAALRCDRRRERVAARLRSRAFVDRLQRVDVRVETGRRRRPLAAQLGPQRRLVDEALQRAREVLVVAGARAQPG